MARPGLSLVLYGGCSVCAGGLLFYFSSIARELSGGEFEVAGIGAITGGLVAICYGLVQYGKHVAQGARSPEERDAINRVALVFDALCYVAGGRGRLTDATVAKVQGALQQLGIPLAEPLIRKNMQDSARSAEALQLAVNDRKYLFSMQERHELLRIAAWVGADGERLSAATVNRLVQLGSFLDLTKEEVVQSCGLLLEQAPPPEPNPAVPPARQTPPEPAFAAAQWLARLHASGLPGLGPGSAAWHSKRQPGRMTAFCGAFVVLVGLLCVAGGEGSFVQIGGGALLLFGLGGAAVGFSQWLDHRGASPDKAAERNKRYACDVLVTAMAYVGHADAGSQGGRIAAFAEVLKQVTGSQEPIPDVAKAFAHFGNDDALQSEKFRDEVPGLSAEQRAFSLAAARRVANAEGPVTRASEERLARITRLLQPSAESKPTVAKPAK
jgi:hypothetical protein